MTLTAIGFDADDTLWHNERFFHAAQRHFETLLADYAEAETIETRLLETESRNVKIYGFGAKSFTLSMIETAIDLSHGKIPAPLIAEILETGRAILTHPVDLLPHVGETLDALRGGYRLILVTKGDLVDQQRKITQSGLQDLFNAVEIVPHKEAQTYRDIFTRHADGPERALMVGNSLLSDVLPMIAAGGTGVHVPHDLTWKLEHAAPPRGNPRFHEIQDLAALPAVIAGFS